QPVPAYLLDAVIELIGMAVWVVDIDVPVAARHVAPDALNADLLLLEIGMGVGDLFEAAALPSDLVDRDLGRKFAVSAMVHHLFWEQHKGVMVGAVAHKIAVRVAEVGVLRVPGCAREIERVRGRKTEQVAVEFAPLGKLFDIKPEVTEPPYLERPGQVDTADIVASVDRWHRDCLLLVACHGPPHTRAQQIPPHYRL